MDNKDLQARRIEATSRLCLEFEKESDSVQEKINALRSLLRIKEIASRNLVDIFTTHIMPLRRFGISALSVLGIAEALEIELSTNLGEMEVIADRLAVITHTSDIRDAYGNISDKLLGEVSEMLDDMKKDRESSFSDDGTLQKVEWGDLWDHLDNDIKNRVS